MSEFADLRLLCSHADGCYRYAMAPPKGYDYNAPVCSSHATRADFSAYEEEIAWNLARAVASDLVFVCAFCQYPITLDQGKVSRAYRLSCCRMFVCGNCTVDVDATCPLCDDDLEVPKEKRHLKEFNVLTRPTPTPVEVDINWGFVKTMIRRLSENQRVNSIEKWANQIIALRKDLEGENVATSDEYSDVLMRVIATVFAIPTFPAFRPFHS